MIALLLAAAALPTAIDAERAFDAMAATKGQWTAFRAFAAPDAIMLNPKPIDAAGFLKGRADPPASVRRQPAASFVSCDGRSAINTGPWQRPDGSHGYFTTVWQRQANHNWKWQIDLGDKLPGRAFKYGPLEIQVAQCGAPRRAPFPAGTTGFRSADGSLRWRYAARADGGTNFAADYWDGLRFHPALADQLHGQ